ncbi:Crp/Fnr family transcriptional regulator [Aestuariivirga litoralis]|nr:Crp/Fnr family transcriptional regulator [Aestuariivirga litoralis]
MISREDVNTLAKSSGWLSKQPSEFQEALLSRCNLRRHVAGEIICNVGDRFTGMFGLVTGIMKIEFATPGQDLKIASVKQSNFWFGQASSLTREAHSVTVTVTKPSSILHISHERFEELMADASYARCFALLTVEHYYEAATALAHLLSDRTEHRIASRLALLAEKAGGVTPIELCVTQNDLAEMCNLSRSVVLQVLKRLEDRGIIQTAYRRIQISDPVSLLAFCSETA